MQRHNVNLVDSAIDHVEHRGIVTADGALHELDAIVLATGFDAHAFMRPMSLVGRDGLTIQQLWDEGPRAHLGVALPGFPNFFMLMGPHSPVGNYSLTAIAEAQAGHILAWIQRWRTGEFDNVAPTRHATDDFNASMRRAMPGTVWASGCTSWYLGADGLPELWPWTPNAYRQRLAATPDVNDYDINTLVGVTMMAALDGRVVAITGGARGIGLATAKAFAAAGAKVAIGDLDADLATRVAADICGNVVARPLDVTVPQSFSAFLDDAVRILGPLDVVVNNAGVMLTGEFVDESSAAEDKMIDINLRGVILGCKLAAERFIRRGGGTIVNVASMAGVGGFPGVATYCATKFGVVGLTYALREELRPHRIQVCAILPGVVHTELSAGVQLPRAVENFVSVEPEHIAAAVVAAVRSNRAISYVPRRLQFVLRTALFIPERPRRFLSRVTRTEQAYLAVDTATRDAYHARAAAERP